MAFHDLFEMIEGANRAIIARDATALGIADPPNTTGVYGLFHDGLLKYIGHAKGTRGLKNRRNNYVSGDIGHTTHRVFLEQFPEKPARRRYIEDNVSMAWFVLPDANAAQAVERALIWRHAPDWNRQ